MKRTRTRTWAALPLGLLLLAVVVGGVACGDDDGDGGGGASGSGAGDGGGDGGGGGSGFEPCALLEVGEIAEQWPGIGPVSDGDPLGSFCTWTLGDQPTDPALTVGVLGQEPGSDAGDMLAAMREIITDPVPADVGDEAFVSDYGNEMYVRSEDNVFSLTSLSFGEPREEHLEKLTALANLVAERLPADYVGT